MMAQAQTEIPFAPPAHSACIQHAGARLSYVYSGNAKFTLRSTTTGKHYTYQVRATNRESAEMAFVSVLTGPDEYTYIGTAFHRGPMKLTRGSKLPKDAPSVLAFQWFQRHPGSSDLELWHSGTCGRCGRELTDPESIATGLGPVCRTRG